VQKDQQIWRIWANFLQRWGVEGWVAAILEAFGPLAIIGAQAVYISKPLLNCALPDDHLETLARIFEDTQRAQAFVDFLREAPTQ
jgi:hypothetical protein